METLTANLLTGNGRGTTRRVVENGVSYLVAPITSITADGVLPGSKGSLLYKSSETRKYVHDWDGIPITVGHPIKNGQHVSAQVVPELSIGELRNSRWAGKLVHDGWFDEEKTKRHDPQVYSALVNHQPMECSSGLYTTNVPAPNGYAVSSHGKPYTAEAKDHVPDHMAILPREVGACSQQDGCGLMVNSYSTPDGCGLAVSESDMSSNHTNNFNPNHGDDGRFDEGGGGSDGERFPSKFNKEVTYANKGDRDSDDRHHTKKIKKAQADVDRITRLLAEAKKALSDHEKGVNNRRTLTWNEWSDAARAASLMARQATATARRATLKAKSPAGVELGRRLHGTDASKAATVKADDAVRAAEKGRGRLHPVGQDLHHRSAAIQHDLAAREHDRATAAAETQGKWGVAKLHRDAAQSHRDAKAAHEHAEKSVANALRNKRKEPSTNRNTAMSDKSWLLRLGEAMGLITNAPERHGHTGQFAEVARTAAKRGMVSDQPRATTGTDYSDYDDENAPAQGMGEDNKDGDDGRDTMLGHREDIDLDGDGDGPVDDDSWRKQDEEAEHTVPPVPQPGNRKSDALGRNAKKQQEERCPECGGGMEDGKCEECGYEDDDDAIENTLTANALDNIWLTYNRDWPQSKRDKLDDSDFAGPDQSFPITSQEDLEAAVLSIGRSKHPAGVIKDGIKRIAKKKGLDLPDSMAENTNPEGINQYTASGGTFRKVGGEIHAEHVGAGMGAGMEHGAVKIKDDRKRSDGFKVYTSEYVANPNADKMSGGLSRQETVHATTPTLKEAKVKAAEHIMKVLQSKKGETTANAFGQPNMVKPVKQPKMGSADAAADVADYSNKLGGVQGMVTNCPKCGGKLTDNTCECGFTKNSLDNTTPPAPVGGGMVMGQDQGQSPLAHAASQQAAVASMDHPPARDKAISAFDHSAAGRDDKAATRHGEAADAHDTAAQQSYGAGDMAGGDQHANAAMLHRKAQAMHSIDPTNMVGNENNGPYDPGQFAMMDKKAGESSGHAKHASANADKMGTASSHAAAADAHRHAWRANKSSGDHEQAAVHEAQAKVHQKRYKEAGGKGKATLNRGTDMRVLNGLNKQQRVAKLKELRPQLLQRLTANCSCSSERKGLQLLNNETLALLVNAKQQGSNADTMGSGDFDDAEEAGGWDKKRVKDDDDTFFDNDDEDKAEDSEDDAKKEPPNQGGGSMETRGRVGVGNHRQGDGVHHRQLTSNEWLAMAPPEVQEQHRLVSNVLRNQKVAVVRQLVGHHPRDVQDRIVKNKRLLERPLQELQDMLLFQQPQQGQTVNAYEGMERPDPVYLGANDVPVHNAISGELMTRNADSDDIACLVPPTINFRRWADEDKMARNGGHGTNYNNGADSIMNTKKEHYSAADAM